MRYDDDDLNNFRYDDDEDDEPEDEDNYRRLDDDDEDDDDDESLDDTYRRGLNTPRAGSGLPGPGSLRSSTGNNQPPAARPTPGAGGTFQRPNSPTPPARSTDTFGNTRPASTSPFSSGGTKPTGPLPPAGSGNPKTTTGPMSPTRPSPSYGAGGSSGSGGGSGNFPSRPAPTPGSNQPVSRPPFGSPANSGSDRGDTGQMRSVGSSDRRDTGPLNSGGTSSSSPFRSDSKPSPFSSSSGDKRDTGAAPNVKKDDPPKKDAPPASTGSGGFMSRVSNLASNLPIGKPGDAKPGDAKKPDAPASSGGFMSRVGNLASNLPIGKKPEEGKPGDARPGDTKKPDAPASGGGFMSRVGNLASSLPIGKKPDEGKPGDAKKPDAPASGGGFMSRVGNLASNLPIGKKPDAPIEPKKDAPSIPGRPSTPGATGSSSPFSSQSSSPGSSTSTPKPSPFGSSPSGSGSSSPFGGSGSSSSGSSSSSSSSPFGNRPGAPSSPSLPDKRSSGEVKTSTGSMPASTGVKFGGAAKKEEDKKTGAASTNAPTQRQSPLGMIRGVLGRNPNPATDTSKEAAVKASATKSGKAAANTASPVSAIMGRFKRVLGVPENSKARRSSIPQTKSVAADEGGLTLDNWLDILGVACTVGSLLLFFSAMSSEKAAIAVIHRFIGQLFGWGALAVPITLFVIGMWLIVRHFGDEPPVIDVLRVVGIVVGFITLLAIFQYIDAFSYREVVPDATDPAFNDLLKMRVDLSWRKLQDGGGAIGGQLYLFLINSVSELGGIFVLIFAAILSFMLITRKTAEDVSIMTRSMYRHNRDRLQHQATARRIKRQMAEARTAELAAQQPQIRIEAPAMPALTAGAQAALPAPATSTTPQIRFNRGALPEAVSVQLVTQANVPGGAIPYPTPVAQDNDGGGLFGRLRRGSRDTGSSAPQAPEGGRGWFNRGSNNAPALPAFPSNPLPLDDDTMLPPMVQPAASVSRSPDLIRPSSSGPSELASSPLPPPGMPGVPAASHPSPVFGGAAADHLERTEPATSQAASLLDQGQARLERMNAIRSGQFAPASVPPSSVAPEDSLTPPSHLPSVQGRSVAPYQEPLNIPPPAAAPLAQPVVGERQSSRQRTSWRLPDARTLLNAGTDQEIDRGKLLKQAKLIEETLNAFDSPGRVVEVNTGPVITQFGVEPGYLTRSGKQQRVKVGAIAALDKDLQLALGAKSIRMEAPVPGKGYVGIEVPNDEPALVSLRDVMDSPGFAKHKSPLAIALGQSVSGVPISADLASMPHVLIAGTTGSGKSVCVNAIIASILVHHTPEEVRFIMVDPKRVELTGYNGIPHLVAPVVVELERIVGVLKWVTREMDDRYRRFSEAGARNIENYNKHRDPVTTDLMAYIVVIIDELADLMMLAPEETERTITRIAALARATGIHLVLATQRPSVDVVTGLIKANFPARIAFAVAGSVDSRVILDQPGAERLLGRGDMLYLSGDSPAPLRLQGVFVSDMEIQNVVRFWKMQAVENPDVTRPAVIFSSSNPSPIPEGGMSRATAKQSGMWTDQGKHPTQAPSRNGDLFEEDYDEPEEDEDEGGDVDDDLYERAVDLVRRLEKASVSLLQRRLRIGYTRAARLIDVMEERGVVGKAKDGSSKPRDVLPIK